MIGHHSTDMQVRIICTSRVRTTLSPRGTSTAITRRDAATMAPNYAASLYVQYLQYSNVSSLIAYAAA
jgi:hypothetical protein